MAMNMNSKGYTLSEAMITVAIVGILAATSAPLMTQMTNFFRQTAARNSIQRDVRHSLDLIDRFTREAQALTVQIDSLSGQPPYSRITYTNIQGQNVSFYQTGNKLYMVRNGDQSLLSSNIAYIAFTYPRTDDNTLISVAVTAQQTTYKGGLKALQLSVQKVRIMN